MQGPLNGNESVIFDGMKPGAIENQQKMREYFELLMKRGAVSMVIHAEFDNGNAATCAVGPPAGLLALDENGFGQLLDMLRRPAKGGENG